MNVQLYIDGTLADVSKDETIALTLTQFDIFNLNVRPSSYSNVFRIPKTQNNRLIFRSAGVINSINTEPYERLSVEVFIDGASIASGTAELISSDGDFFRVAVKVASNDFFTRLKSLKLSDLTSYLEPLDHDYDSATVSARRDVTSAIVYPNVDYGYFERADLATDQPFTRFFPALRLFYVFDSAFDLLGYTKRGTFWNGQLYNGLAIMAKGIFNAGALYLAEYGLKSGFDFFVSRSTDTSGQVFTNTSPLNFTDEESDEDNLYVDTDLGLGYTTLAYNFAENFDVTAKMIASISGTVRFENTIEQTFIDENITTGAFIIKLQLWNKTTDTFVETIASTFPQFYNSLGFRIEFTAGIFDPNITFSSSVANNATDYALLWEVSIQTTTLGGEPVSTTDFFPNVSFEADFKIEQLKPNQTDVSVVNSFDDIDIGKAFLTLCNIGGLIPNVDEATKTIEMITFDNVRKNKSKALDWSNKLDLSSEPEVTFRIDGTAQNNIFKYALDTDDSFLKTKINYGQGSLAIANENLQNEIVKYEAPYSLCDIANTFLGGATERQMAVIDSGPKWVFDGVDYNLDPDAVVDAFKTRIVFLNRSTENLIQVDTGAVVTGNYEVNNEVLFFNNIIQNEYALIASMFDKAKIVKALIRLNIADVAQIDFSKPVYIDYFNDYFYINEISQFKANEVDSTFVTLIRM